MISEKIKIGNKPEITPGIHFYVGYLFAEWSGQPAKAFRSRIVFVKTFFGSYPHDIWGVDIQRMNKIAADAAVFIRIIPEYLKRIAIKPVKAVFGAEPQKSFLILNTTDDCIIWQSIFYLEMTEIIWLPAGFWSNEN